MKNILINISNIIFFLPIVLVKKIIIICGFNKKSRNNLGEICYYMRQYIHLMEREKILEKYHIHSTVRWDFNTQIYGEGNINIGEYTYIGRNSFLLSNPKGITLNIGKYCAISHGVHIRTEIHKHISHYKDEIKMPPLGADIIIGDYVWIGANVFIRGGIKIGDNSIIGANSVVTHNIPPNTVYGGTPARLIRHKTDFPDDNGNQNDNRQ